MRNVVERDGSADHFARTAVVALPNLVAQHDDARCTRFRVRRYDQLVPPAEWRSKKAQSLLKILISRNGRPAPRDLLKETLWPGADPARSGPSAARSPGAPFRLEDDKSHIPGRYCPSRPRVRF